jgi:excisionase family DNA binding protein
MSVAEAAQILQASEAYVRRLLATQRLFGIKVGPVWAIYRDDLEGFQRMRRQPGRPPKSAGQGASERKTRSRINAERAGVRTEKARLKPSRQ